MLWRIPLAQPVWDSKEKRNFKPVSIIIPARNEALNLPVLLKSLADQNIQPHELIVVDDHSTDDTARIACDAGAIVIHLNELDDGWIGKSRACWQGALYARGVWLLFLDADTQMVGPDSLQRMLITYESLGGQGSISFQPYHVVVRFYESLSAIFNIILMAGMNVFTPWGERIRSAGLFGPCLLCRHEDYFAVGGHEAVRGDVMDDLALGESFRKGGLPVHCLGGRGVISFRMYPDSLGQLIDGWAKGFGASASSTHPVVLGLIIAWISGGFSSLALLLNGVTNGILVRISVGIIAYLFYALQMFWLARRVGRFQPLILMLYPILLLFFITLFSWSLIRTKMMHTVIWKGRKIRV